MAETQTAPVFEPYHQVLPDIIRAAAHPGHLKDLIARVTIPENHDEIVRAIKERWGMWAREVEPLIDLVLLQKATVEQKKAAESQDQERRREQSRNVCGNDPVTITP